MDPIVDNKANVAANGPVRVEKTVTIFRKENTSAYFRKNSRYIPEGKNKIGSAIASVDRMKSNFDELTVYMPSILGCSANDPKFAERLDAWFNNISKIVPEIGLPLNIGFTYKSRSFADSISEKEKEIADAFTKAKKSTSEERDLAFKVRDEAIINLESTKYQYGFPINVGDYMVWRYCLVYSSVANDIALINKSGAIRFYMYDPDVEKHKETIQFNIRKEATIAYVKLLEEPSKIGDILWMHLGDRTDVSKMDEMTKLKALETLNKVDPDAFLRYYKDVNLTIKAKIERMIHFGILRRLEGTNIIVDENNDVIGNNTAEVLTFFKNAEANKAAITRFQSKLNNYTNG